MEQKPSIGRVVHYQSYGTPVGEYPSVSRASIITEVYPGPDGEPSSSVGLAVLNPTGLFFNRNVPYDTDGRPGTWRWPPRA